MHYESPHYAIKIIKTTSVLLISISYTVYSYFSLLETLENVTMCQVFV